MRLIRLIAGYVVSRQDCSSATVTSINYGYNETSQRRCSCFASCSHRSLCLAAGSAAFSPLGLVCCAKWGSLRSGFGKTNMRLRSVLPVRLFFEPSCEFDHLISLRVAAEQETSNCPASISVSHSFCSELRSQIGARCIVGACVRARGCMFLCVCLKWVSFKKYMRDDVHGNLCRGFVILIFMMLFCFVLFF